MEQKEFTIEGYENKFRSTKVKPLDMLALQTQINFDDMIKTKELFKFALEHLEVKVLDQWIPVKEPNKEVYYPIGIEDNYKALKSLIEWFIENVVRPVF